MCILTDFLNDPAQTGQL